MRLLAALLLLPAACRSAPPRGEPATLTLLGETGRLEAWDAEAVEGDHLHALPGAPCGVFEGIGRVVEAAGEPRLRDTSLDFSRVLEGLAVTMFGRAYGGPGRLALALRKLRDGGPVQEEALLVVLPALPEGPGLRTFRAPDLEAELVDAEGRTRAAFESGRVAARRLGGTRWEFELFLVLRSEAGRVQVVARLEAGGAR